MHAFIILANLIFLGLIISFLYKKLKNTSLAPFFLHGLLLKCSAGVALGLLYKYYFTGYTGDSFMFFSDASLLRDLAFDNPGRYLRILLFSEYKDISPYQFNFAYEPRSFLFVKILSWVNIISFNNYWVSGIYLSLFSFLGMFLLASTLVELFPATRFAAIIAFLCFPSVVFWTSGVMKESVIIGSLCFLGSFLLKIIVGREKLKGWHYCFSVVFLYWAVKLKYYYAGLFIACFLPSFIILYITQRTGKKPALSIQALCWVLLFLTSIFIASQLHYNLRPERILEVIVQNHNIIFNASSPANLIHYQNLNPTIKSVLLNLPLALFSGLFRPQLVDIHNFFQLFTAIENSMLIILSISALIKLKNNIKPEVFLLIVGAIAYILILSITMAFSSPNFGTLTRYKAGFLPLFLFLILINNPAMLLIKKIGERISALFL